MSAIEIPSAMPTQEERELAQYLGERGRLEQARLRAAVVRAQITNAASILDAINFLHVGDTAFVEKIYKAKNNLATALGDFLLDDGYWKGRLEHHNTMTPGEYALQVSSIGQCCGTAREGL